MNCRENNLKLDKVKSRFLFGVSKLHLMIIREPNTNFLWCVV